MRTNIVLDDKLVEEAFKFAGAKTKRELINTVLLEFVQNHKRMNMKELFGEIEFSPEYNYKSLRKSKTLKP